LYVILIAVQKTIIMETIQHIQKKRTDNLPALFFVLRVALGFCLFIKGISFMRNMGALESLLTKSSLAPYSSWLAIVITWAHFLGGFLVAIGLFTRPAVVLQIPILVGALIFINRPGEDMGEFLFALAILILLVLFLRRGGGLLSLDRYFTQNPV
jgi:uncharacterized membrane protein YphA (DoxX/SURF4 family)